MSKIIALDAGHGYNTAGKRCMKKLDPDETREWYLNDRIIDLVEKMLKNYECTVLRVDDTTGRKDISLAARVKAANNIGSDIYLSMHHNAGMNGRKGGGTLVFYHSTKVNRPVQARKLYNHIVSETGLVGNRSEQAIKKNYYVLRKTVMPAFLVENGFMDSPDDVPVILSQKHAEKTAQGVVAFLVEELSLQTRTSPEPEESKIEMYYPAYTGKNTTLSIAMDTLGLDYSYEFRKKIAAKNNITGYRGTAPQNIYMYNLLVAGLLKKV